MRRIIQSPDHEEIIRALHDQGHLGVKSVMSKLKQRYWWPKMQKHVEEFIRTCDTCQRDKLPPKATDIRGGAEKFCRRGHISTIS